MQKIKHLRKPASLGGDESPENVSFVSMTEREAWNRLFGDMGAEDICTKINGFYPGCRFEFVCRSRRKKLEPQDFIPGCECAATDHDEMEAWNVLFRNMDLEAIRQTINDVWLDPHYNFLRMAREEGPSCPNLLQVPATT